MKMDSRKLIEVLHATLESDQRKEAENQLSLAHKVIGFCPTLLQVVMQNDVPLPIRQAGVVYLKNQIVSGWPEREPEEGEIVPFSIQEVDKVPIREVIVEAVVHAPPVIQVQLCICLNTIIKFDFPERWTNVVDAIHIYIQNTDPSIQMGALLSLYQLIKCFEYQSTEKRLPLIKAMTILLPIIQNTIIKLQPDQSVESVMMQKQILKCFFALTKNILPLELLNQEVFTNWMAILRTVLIQSVPEHTLATDEEERLQLPWWKIKKWAAKILYRIFERYGSPANTKEEYRQFAEWFLKTFTKDILETQLGILDQYRHNIYVSPRVLQVIFNYIDQCVSHALSWKLLKPHMFTIIKEIIFPLMSHSDSDEELWNTDPQEYIRIKYDIFEDSVSPVRAAEKLLVSACKKRKHILEPTVQLCTEILTNQAGEPNPRRKDGAFHIIGSLGDILLKKYFKECIDSFCNDYVFREFNSQFGYLRARACWLLHSFASARFKNDQILMQAVHLLVNTLLADSQLPVKVEASIAIQTILEAQEPVVKYLEPQITNIMMELLNVIHNTESDEVANVLQRIVPRFTDKLMPIAYQITESLVGTFNKIIESEDTCDDEKAITAMSLLNAIETILDVMEDDSKIMAQLEPLVLRTVVNILQHKAEEFFEEAMSLLTCLTSNSVSINMWDILILLNQALEKEGIEYFMNMMPVLHNLVTVDTKAFLSNENNFRTMYQMAEKVLNCDSDEEIQLYGAKLLEVMILQCPEEMKNFYPMFIELVLKRLMRGINTPDLRVMLLLVLIAMMITDPQHFFSVMSKLQESIPNTSIIHQFIKQWMNDASCFSGLHDRKLCVLGICTLLETSIEKSILNEVAPTIIPICLEIFKGLKRAYEARAENEDDSSDDSDEDDENEDALSSDEDEIDEMNNEYLEHLARMAANKSTNEFTINAEIHESDDEDDTDDEDYDQDETEIECFTTPLDSKDSTVDEYIKFKTTLMNLSVNEPEFYKSLLGVLSEEQIKEYNAVMLLSDQRKAQQESKRIEQNGGYSFTVPSKVPSTFKFG